MRIRRYVLVNKLTGLPVNRNGRLRRFISVRSAARYASRANVMGAPIGSFFELRRLL